MRTFCRSTRVDSRHSSKRVPHPGPGDPQCDGHDSDAVGQGVGITLNNGTTIAGDYARSAWGYFRTTMLHLSQHSLVIRSNPNLELEGQIIKGRRL